MTIDELKIFLQESVPSQEYFQNPYFYLERMREISAILWMPNLKSWLVTDYATVNQGLKDKRFSVNRKQKFFDNLSTSESSELQPLRNFFERWLMFIDPPYHEKLKSLLTKSFSPASMRHFSERISSSAEKVLIDTPNGEVDFLESFAIPYSVNALAEILGIDADDYISIVHWTEQLLSFYGGNSADISKGREALPAYHGLVHYMNSVIDSKKENAGVDIISELVHFMDEGVISRDELSAIVANLLVDGHEPVAHTLSNGVYELLQNPEQLRKLNDNPSLIPQTAEEFLRINPYFQYSARRATEDLELGDVSIKENERVMFMLGAANRDPKVFESPNELQLDRQENKHLSFGQGIHFCLGAALGRATTKIALEKIISTKNISTIPNQRYDWKQSVGYRGLQRLPLHWESK